MFHVCPNCGEYRAGNAIVQKGVYAKCLNCGFRHKFLRLPLFILTGASGVGKSTVCLKLAARMKDVVVMDSDILHAEPDPPETNHDEYRETWLRVCKYIAQAGKPVVLCGVAEPTKFEQCIERRFFSELHYLVLICNEQVHASRLQNRPMWSGSSRDKFIKEQVKFNRWLLDNASITKPPMTLLDTSELTIDETTEEVARWIQSRMKRPRRNTGGTVAVLEWRAWKGFLLAHVLGDHGVRIEADPFREYSSAQLDRLCDSFTTVCFQINLSVRHRLPMGIRDLTDRFVERGVYVVNGLVQDIRKSSLHAHLEVLGLPSAKATPSGDRKSVV